MFPPEANYYALALGAGPAPSLAAAETYVGHHAAMTATVGTSSALGAVTAESYIGVGGTASEAALVSHNNEHLVLAEEALTKGQIMHMAAAAHPTHLTQMVPAPPAHANRFEEAADEVINPLVWGALTPRITDLNLEYFGFMWPNNAAAGVRYGATLDALGSALLMPSMPAISGGSIAGVAVAAASVAESAALSGMQAAVGMVGSGVSAVAGPAAALPATAMSAVSSSGSSVASAPATSAPVQPLAAVTQTAPPTPAQTMAPAQASTGMYAPSPNANLMTPPPVPPTAAQPPVQPMMPRPPMPAMPASPGVTSFTPPAEPFSPPPPPTAGRATGLAPGMLNASALRGPVSAPPASTALLTKPLTTTSSLASEPLAYVTPDVPRPVSSTPPLQDSGSIQTLNPPPQPQQAPPHPSPPQQPSTGDGPPPGPSTGNGGAQGSGGPGTQTPGSGQGGEPPSPLPATPLDTRPPPIPPPPSPGEPPLRPPSPPSWAQPQLSPTAQQAQQQLSKLEQLIQDHNAHPPDPGDWNAVNAYNAEANYYNSWAVQLHGQLDESKVEYTPATPAQTAQIPSWTQPAPQQPNAPTGPNLNQQATQIGKDVGQNVPKGSRLNTLIDRLNQLHIGNQQQAAEAADAAARAAWGETAGIVNGPNGSKLVLPANPLFGQAIMVAPDGTLSAFRGDLFQFLPK